MKKFLIFVFTLVFLLTAVSCSDTENADIHTNDFEETGGLDFEKQQAVAENGENMNEETTDGHTTKQKTEESLETSDTTYGESESFETIIEETTMSLEDRYNIGMEYVMNYNAWILTDGKEYEPYTSMLYCQNPYITGDGILMFISMENQLPKWIDEVAIPEIALNENSELQFEHHEMAELICSGRFKIYLYEEGVVTNVKSFENGTLADVFAYGKENLSGKTAYISYPFRLEAGDYSDLPDVVWSDYAVQEVMCIFSTSF